MFALGLLLPLLPPGYQGPLPLTFAPRSQAPQSFRLESYEKLDSSDYSSKQLLFVRSTKNPKVTGEIPLPANASSGAPFSFEEASVAPNELFLTLKRKVVAGTDEVFMYVRKGPATFVPFPDRSRDHSLNWWIVHKLGLPGGAKRPAANAEANFVNVVGWNSDGSALTLDVNPVAADRGNGPWFEVTLNIRTRAVSPYRSIKLG